MSAPHAKGTLILTPVKGIRSAIRAGALDRTAIESGLSRATLEVVDAKISATEWYPFAALTEMVELLARQIGGDRETALRTLGAASVDSIRQIGLYSQLDYEPGKLARGTLADYGRFARLASSVFGSFFDFGTMTSGVDADARRLTLRHEDVAPMMGRTWHAMVCGWATGVLDRAVGRPHEAECEVLASDAFSVHLAIDPRD